MKVKGRHLLYNVKAYNLPFSWTLLNPSASLQMWLSDGYLLQLRPEPEYSGDLALSVKPIVKNWDGNVDNGKKLEIIMKVI